MSAATTHEALTRFLHRHICGTEWDEWNQPCAWAGEDWDPENGPANCAYVDEIGVEAAVFEWVATLADDEALVERLASGDVHRHYRAVSWGSLSLDSQARYMADMRATLRDLAAALAEATS